MKIFIEPRWMKYTLTLRVCTMQKYQWYELPVMRNELYNIKLEWVDKERTDLVKRLTSDTVIPSSWVTQWWELIYD